MAMSDAKDTVAFEFEGQTIYAAGESMVAKLVRERDEWKRACPQSSVCPKCGFQTVHRYPEPPGAGEVVLLQEIRRLRALLREVVAVVGRCHDCINLRPMIPGEQQTLAERINGALEGRNGS